MLLSAILIAIVEARGGVEIETKTELPRRGLLRRIPSCDVIFREIQSSIEQSIEEPLLRKAVRFHKDGNVLFVYLHPAGTPLEFYYSPEKKLTAYAKTSGAGPGFHAFVVELLKNIEGKCGFEWRWDVFSESKYYQIGDFSALQHDMAVLLKAISNHISKYEEGVTTFSLNWPINYPYPIEKCFTVYPKGKLSKEWFSALADANEQIVKTIAAEYYPWWDKELNARFWCNYGLVLCWFEIPWHVPNNDQEEQMYQLAIDCFKKAKEINPDIELPVQEIEELKNLINRAHAGDFDVVPKVDGIGFRQHLMKFKGTGAWTIEIPGYYYITEQDEGQTVVFWFADRAVHFSSLQIEPEKGKVFTKDDILDQYDSDKSNDKEIIEFEKDYLKGRAEISLIEENDEKYLQLTGRMACGSGGNTLAIIIITSMNLKDKDWMVSTFKSVSYPEPKP